MREDYEDFEVCSPSIHSSLGVTAIPAFDAPRAADAQAPTIYCNFGSFGSGSGFSSVTVCSANMALLNVNSNLFTPSGSADDYANGTCVFVFACTYASAFKYRTISPAGGPWLVAGTHFSFPPPGYGPPAAVNPSIYYFYP